MTKSTWSAVLVAGLLLTAIGFGIANPTDGTLPQASAAAVLTLLLTAGLAACLAATLGLTGWMGWMTGLQSSAPVVKVENID